MPDDIRKSAIRIIERLEKAYPEARQELNFKTPFELLIATILAAQCTDARVNLVTERVFKKYKDPKAYLSVDPAELRQDLQGITFTGSKTKYIRACCDILIKEHKGQVPASVEELTKLPGVGRKTANIVLANSMGIPAIGVDTHTIRVPNRLGWIDSTNPDKVEKRLSEILPREKWHRSNIVIQWHGRYTCKAKKPLCKQCTIFELCPWTDKASFN